MSKSDPFTSRLDQEIAQTIQDEAIVANSLQRNHLELSRTECLKRAAKLVKCSRQRFTPGGARQS